MDALVSDHVVYSEDCIALCAGSGVRGILLSLDFSQLLKFCVHQSIQRNNHEDGWNDAEHRPNIKTRRQKRDNYRPGHRADETNRKQNEKVREFKLQPRDFGARRTGMPAKGGFEITLPGQREYMLAVGTGHGRLQLFMGSAKG